MTLIPAWNGEFLAPSDKLDVHRRGLRHLAVSAFVMRGDTLLLQRRAASKYHTPGLWTNSCCTHPHWGEDPRDCARRRLSEELGIEGLAPVLRHQLEYRADVGGGLTEHEVVDVFRAEAPDDLALDPNPDEVSGVRWITLADLDAEIAAGPARFTPWLRIYLDTHRDAILGA